MCVIILSKHHRIFYIEKCQKCNGINVMITYAYEAKMLNARSVIISLMIFEKSTYLKDN